MPQRSNPFQRVIRLIEQQLAPTGATIEESALLVNRASGELTEVDVLITLGTGASIYRVGIECQRRSRKATVQWARELRGKYQLLDVNRVVAVTNRGFTPGARTEAAFFGITLLTIEEAARFDWEPRIRLLSKLMVMDLLYKQDGIQVEVSGSGAGPSGFANDLRQTAICLPRTAGNEHLGEYVISAHGFLDRTLAEPGVDALLALRTQSDPDRVGWLCADLPSGSAIFDVTGRRFGLHKLCFRMPRSVVAAEVPLRHGGYDGAAVATGSTSAGGEIDVALVEMSGEAVSGAVRVLNANHEWIWNVGDLTAGLTPCKPDREACAGPGDEEEDASTDHTGPGSRAYRRISAERTGITWSCSIYERTREGGFRRGVQEPIEFVLCVSQSTAVILALPEGDFASLSDEDILDRIERAHG